MATTPKAPKEPLDRESFEELNQAWADSEQLPEADRAEFRNFLQAKRAEYLQHYDAPLDAKGPLDHVAATALGALDYGSGLVRTPSMAAAATLAGRPELVTAQDWKDAINPLDERPAPAVGEYLHRAGVPEGTTLLPEAVRSMYAEPGSSHPWYQPEKGGMLDPTLRGAVGLVGDTALSPAGVSAAVEGVQGLRGMTRAQQLAKMRAPEVVAALKAEAAKEAAKTPGRAMAEGAARLALDPAGEALEKGGDAVYRTVFKKADEMAAKGGQQRTSDVLLKNGVWGTDGMIEKQADQIRKKLSGEVSDTMNRVGQENPTLVASRADIRRPVNEMLFQKQSEPGTGKAATSALNKLAEEFQGAYGKTKRTFDLGELDTIKKNYQQKTRIAGGYNPQGALPSRPTRAVDNAIEAKVLTDANSMTANKARRAGEDLLDKAEPGLGGQTYLKNADIASLMAGDNALERNAGRSLIDSAKDSATAALVGGGLGVVPAYIMQNPKLAALMAAAGVGANSTIARTGLGLAAKKYGRTAANVGRASLLENYGEGVRAPSPWSLLNEAMDADQKGKRNGKDR